jgi:putative ABC transport system permease protein
MLKNYFKLMIRTLYRDKWYSATYIVGLAIGMCVALLLSIYVFHELSFDKFHKDYSSIYRIHNHFSREGLEEERLPCTLYNSGESIAEKVPEVESVLRIMFWDTGDFSIDNQTRESKSIIYTDSIFFRMFNFPIVKGNAVNPLAEPNSIVITEKIAHEWFGDEDPIGKSIRISTIEVDTIARRLYSVPKTLTVNAVAANVPKNSHIEFEVVTSFKSMSERFLRGQGQDFFTYVKLTSPLTESLKSSIGNLNAFEIEKGFGKNRPAELTRTVFIPLHKIHLHANYPYDRAITSSHSFVLTLGVVAGLVLLIASINFINLTTARANKRKREVGIRKVVGSLRKQIVVQFIGESVLSAFFALVFALIFLELLLNPFNNLLKTELSYSNINNIPFLLGVLGITILIGVFGGLYPSFYVSSFKPIAILKGLTHHGAKKSFAKTTLIIFQFGMSSLLVFGLIVITSQMKFVREKDLGFKKENVVLFFGITSQIAKSYNTIVNDLKSMPNVHSVSAAHSYPGAGLSGMNLRLEEADASQAFSIKENRVHDYYIETLGMQIVEGRDFIPNQQTDDDSYIINQTAARMLGIENPVGARVIMWRRPGTIIGVVKDYHFASLRDNIEPLIISRYNKGIGNISVRIDAKNKRETVKQISDHLAEYDHNYNLRYEFLEDNIDNLYGSEKRTFKLILSASLIAIFLSMVGLYALSSYTLENRKKEVSIRKILGASIQTIYGLLTLDSTKFVLIANLIALPIGWYFAKDWLNNFAFRVDIEPWVFIVTILSTYIVALLTIIWQIVKTSNTNPVEALRYE